MNRHTFERQLLPYRSRISFSVLAVVLCFEGSSFNAHGFQMGQIRPGESGEGIVDYESDPNGRFTLFQGDSITNISTAVATADGRLGIGQFIITNAFTQGVGFWRISREEI